MGAARNLEAYEPSSEQLDALVANDNSFDTTKIHNINKRKNNIRDMINSATEFNLQEKEEIYGQLDSIDSTDLSKISDFGKTIEGRREKIKATLVDPYKREVNKNREFFGRDSEKGYDAADQYIEEFMQRDEAGKEEWLDALKSEIDQRVKLFKRAEKLVPGRMEHVQKLKRSELKDYLDNQSDINEKYIAQCDEILGRNEKLFSQEEISDYKAQIADMTASKQLKFVNDIRKSLKERKDIEKIYDSIPSEYRKKWGNFSSLSLDEKRETKESLEVDVATDFEKKQQKHRLGRHIGDKDKKMALAFVRKATLPDKIKALQNLDSQFEKQKNDVSDPCRKILTELAKTIGKKEAKTKKDVFYDAGTYEERYALLSQYEAELDEVISEEKEKVKDTKNYKILLQKSKANKHISTKTEQLALKLWGKMDAHGRKEALKAIIEDPEDRKGITKRYKDELALADKKQTLTEDQKTKFSFRQFAELSLTRRTKLLGELLKLTGSEDTVKEKTKDSLKDKDESDDSKETSKVNKIETLTTQAAQAERKKDYIKAEKLYNQIIELDQDDPVAKRNLKSVQSQMEETSSDNEENISAKEEKNFIRQIDEAQKAQHIKRRRKRFHVSREIADEAKASQELHGGAIKASEKTKDLNDEDKVIAKGLEDQYGENYVLEDGKGVKTQWTHYKGMRLDSDREAPIEKNVVNNIIRKGDQKKLKHLVFYDDADNVVDAKRADEQVGIREEELRNVITNQAARKDDNKEKVRKVVDKKFKKRKDFDVELSI